jgi:aspartate aminotransferase-like enzyme
VVDLAVPFHTAVTADQVARALAADPSLPLIAGGGTLSKEMIRVNHYGVDATRGAVQSSLAALGAALADAGRKVDLEAARKAVSEAWPSE